MKEIILTQGKVALVDDEDYEALNKHLWYVLNNYNYTFYAVRNSPKNGKQTLLSMHRVILKVETGLETDHIDGNGLNNQKRNLRVVTSSQNSMNQRKIRGTSKFKGVCWCKASNKWKVQIRVNKKQYGLGYFKDEIEAAQAYNKKAIELFGEYAYINKF